MIAAGAPDLASFVDERLVADPTVEVGQTVPLAASRCTTCGRVEFPALTDCPTDGSSVEPVTLGPSATLTGFTEVLHAPPGAEVDVPYTLAVATFADHNLSVLGRLDQHIPADELTIGDPIEVVVATYRQGRTYAYRPV